ncbi:MAG TPA: T9SS type A sorting domain-containing protein, partial [Puia sp.]|nr:T9SS type A sorting domain-containing protein [Puia sp.]
QVSLFLFNLMGRSMMSTMLNVQRGSNYFSFPVGGLSTGVYIVRIKGIGLDAVQKIGVGNMGISGQ